MTAAFDLHIHTQKYSDCSFIHPEELIAQALEAGLNGFALTEHGMRWPDEEFARLENLARPQGLVLINGQEISARNEKNEVEGDFLVFGVQHSLTGRYGAAELVELVHEQKGIVIAAHPYKLSRRGKTHYYGAGDKIYQLPLDAIELYHPDHSSLAVSKAQKAMQKLGIPAWAVPTRIKSLMLAPALLCSNTKLAVTLILSIKFVEKTCGRRKDFKVDKFFSGGFFEKKHSLPIICIIGCVKSENEQRRGKTMMINFSFYSPPCRVRFA